MITFFPSRTVAIEIFGWPIHWYGIMYLLAFIAAFILLPNIQRKRNLHLTRDEWASLMSWAVLGVIGGGRLGYVLFYEPQYFTIHPRQIFFLWQGGMSSHGGFIGVALLLSLFCYLRKIDLRRLADIVVVPVAIGMAFGRFGNFINQELYGSVTDLPWGIAIPGVEGLRHPTQLYAIAKNLFIAGVCYWHLSRTVRPGRTFALFLMLYGILRFLIEFLRVQDYPLIDLGMLELSRGQLLTLPLMFIGALLWVWFGREDRDA